ncbi:hypothetical protein ABXV22_22915 [Vibrio rotiferianus]|uniref:hypothetical protein n=1 Tax=Vibrio rotiferianus TaxID=190895 RepID=UPI003398D7CA
MRKFLILFFVIFAMTGCVSTAKKNQLDYTIVKNNLNQQEVYRICLDGASVQCGRSISENGQPNDHFAIGGFTSEQDGVFTIDLYMLTVLRDTRLGFDVVQFHFQNSSVSGLGLSTKLEFESISIDGHEILGKQHQKSDFDIDYDVRTTGQNYYVGSTTQLDNKVIITLPLNKARELIKSNSHVNLKIISPKNGLQTVELEINDEIINTVSLDLTKVIDNS